MRPIIRTVIALIAFLAVCGAALADTGGRIPGPRGMTGPQGPIGPRGNAVLNGAGGPSNLTGVEGDFYVDTTAHVLYGPKTSSAWPGSPLVLGVGASPLLGSLGGTGWNNSGFTIKLGGNLQFAGAYGVTFTVTSATTLTLPTTGTLLTTTGNGSALTGLTAGQVGGLAASATTDATNAANITSGTLPAARLPTPAASTLGGIKSSTASAGQFATGVDTAGNVTYGTPTGSGTVNTGTTDQVAYYAGNGTAVSGTGSIFALLPTGAVIPYAGSSAPTGYLLCFGQAVSRTTYAGLFATIGTTYGVGDGSTTFNLPDLRGRVAAGVDNMGGSAANRLGSGNTGGITGTASLGATGGTQSHTLTTGEMPSHSHSVTDPGHTHDMLTRTDVNTGGSAGAYASSSSALGQTTQLGTTGITIQSTGGGGAHNNLQPTLVLNYIIRQRRRPSTDNTQWRRHRHRRAA